MLYKTAGSIAGKTPVRIREHWWKQVLQKLEIKTWQQGSMMLVFGVLLAVVVYLSTRNSTPLLAVAALAALALVVAAIARPALALLLVFVGAGLPSFLLQLSQGGHTIRPIELALALCLLIILLRRPGLQLQLPHMLMLLFFAICIVSYIHVPNSIVLPTTYSPTKEVYAIVLLLVAIFIGTFFVPYIENMSTFLMLLLLGNIPLYLIALAQGLGVHLSTLFEDPSAQDPLQSGGRLWGPFEGAATFGAYLAGLFAVALICWLLGAKRRERWVGAVMTIATGLTIVGSGTRSSTIAAIVTVIIALIVTRRFKLLLGATIATSIAVVIFLNKILPKFTHSDTSVSNRITLWQYALHIIYAHPWLGIGLQEFYAYYNKLIVAPGARLDTTGISVHNQYLEYAMEGGIGWLLAFLLMTFSIIYLCAKYYRRAQRSEQGILLVACLTTITMLIISTVDVPFDKPEGAVFYLVLTGLALGCVRRIRQREFASDGAAYFPAVAGVRASSATGSDMLYAPVLAGRATRRSPISTSTRTNTDELHGVPARTNTDELSATDGSIEAVPSARKTGRAVFVQLFTWGTSALIMFPATALMTRYFGPVQYGEYSYTLPFLAVFALMSGTGMDPLIIRQLSRQKRSEWRDTLSYAAGTRIVSTLVMSGLAVLVAFLLPVSGEQRLLLLLGSCSLVFSFSFNGFRTIYECGFWAEQRVGSVSLLEAINRVGTAVLIGLAVLLHLSLMWTYILIVYSDIPFFLLLVALATRRYKARVRFDVKRMREYFVGSLALTGHNALTLFVNQAGVLLLLPLAGSLSVGIYSLATRMTNPLLTIAITYVLGLYPLLCAKFEQGREVFSATYNEAIRLIALAIIPLSLFVTLEARPLTILLGGAKFSSASVVVQLLMWATALTFFVQFVVRASMAANKERTIPYITGISLTLNIVANLLLIPHFQATGAALAAVVSQLSSLVLFSLLLVKHTRQLQALGVVVRVLLGSLPASLVVFWFHSASLLVLAPAFGILVLAGCVVTRTLSLKDVTLAKQMVLKRAGKATQEQKDVEKGAEEGAERNATRRLVDIADEQTLILPRIVL
jgi:O-antigen/teichoic acid export membrane protein